MAAKARWDNESVQLIRCVSHAAGILTNETVGGEGSMGYQTHGGGQPRQTVHAVQLLNPLHHAQHCAPVASVVVL